MIYTAVTGFGVMNSLFVLLLGLDGKTLSDAFIQSKIEGYMDQLKNDVKDIKEVREMVSWIVDDKFDAETTKSLKNQPLINKLNELKDSFLSFYFNHLEDVTANNSDINRSCDIHTTIGKYVLQLMRLRLVIQPEIQIAMNKHTHSHIDYMAVKAFWIEENGEKRRRFTKSLGRAEKYKSNIKNEQAVKDSIALLQPVMYKTYLESYTK